MTRWGEAARTVLPGGNVCSSCNVSFPPMFRTFVCDVRYLICQTQHFGVSPHFRVSYLPWELGKKDSLSQGRSRHRSRHCRCCFRVILFQADDGPSRTLQSGVSCRLQMFLKQNTGGWVCSCRSGHVSSGKAQRQASRQPRRADLALVALLSGVAGGAAAVVLLHPSLWLPVIYFPTERLGPRPWLRMKIFDCGGLCDTGAGSAQ